MKMEVGKTYRVKKEIFNFKKGEILILADKGYQAYYGEYNFVFVNEKKEHQYAVLRDGSDEDMKVYHHLDEYFEEVSTTEI
ncbi:phosphohydrolase [Filifactor alocis]|uniref:phosphohydrolase n=1 Tax=Filifactor alocis TaxID=143361 RepID=UPI0028D8689F|nr:phosphohydrolase [Filifactor alocis]